MENEKIRILKLVESGKLTADEAAKLLEALQPETGMKERKADVVSKARFLKIRVSEDGQSRPKVNVVLPLGLIRLVNKIVPESAKIQLEERNIDLDQIISAIDETTGGKILEVHDEEEGEHVEIVVE